MEKWKDFRKTTMFIEADIVKVVDDLGTPVDIPSDKLQRKRVIDYRWLPMMNGLKVLEVTIKL